MLTVHHLGVSQSERIVWLCEELEIPYSLLRYGRDPKTQAAPTAYKALHSMGLAPVITDEGLILAESGAIVDYVIAKYGSGRLVVTPDQSNYTDYLFWYHFANGTLMPARMVDLVVLHLMSRAGGQAAPNPRADMAFGLVEARLSGVPYLAGDELTAADIMTVFPLSTMRYFAPRDLAPYPNIRAYLRRIGERPAYQRAMAASDPGMKLLLD